MMIHVTEEDMRMIQETKKWEYFGEDGYFHLREDTPPEIKKHVKKMANCKMKLQLLKKT